jgi:cobalt-precorrin 5A hydrolase/precorrin-3B C17-methyltransferase
MFDYPNQSLVAIATTPVAVQTLQRICLPHQIPIWVPPSLLNQPDTQTYSASLREHVAHLWQTHQGLIFGLATGAVVRLISPLLHDKSTDPAVVVVDETGRFVISLCSGHQGHADQLTRWVALHLGATAVLTGSVNAQQLPAIDTLGIPFGWRKGTGDWTGVSAAIARRETVDVIQTAGTSLWRAQLPESHPFRFLDDADEDNQANAQIWITPFDQVTWPDTKTASRPSVQWHPRILWLGIGCERNTHQSVIEAAVRYVLQQYHLAAAAVAGVATIDLKADEPGILELCRDRHWALHCFSAADLSRVEVPTPSAIVEKEVGTASVAEAAAILAGAGCRDSGSLTMLRNGSSNVSGCDRLLVPKQIFRLDGQSGAVTVAIAQAEQELTGRNGQLWLVGIGPGSLDQMTPAAQAALTQADAIIGYELYIDLVRPLLQPRQIIEALPITQERQRAERAIKLAQWGLTVAVISSGDCGIYGMAGLVMEQLQACGWNGQIPQVQVFPGITALQAAASRVGAPLMHDFCAISLSDLLTPWPMIETRLTAAAQADFVVALYNPKSQTRTEPIAIAQAILLKHREPETPVALVRSAYRADETITLTTLAQFTNEPIDMLTTVLIGNSTTRRHKQWMMTPRGYFRADTSQIEPNQT